MKKYVLLFIFAVFAVSCSQKVEIKGKVTGGSPLERIELTEASGVATLPLINIGVDKEGNFSGSFEAPKNGMYELNYAGKGNLIYLKKGQTLSISGAAATFPNEFKIEGDAKNDNEFLQQFQKFLLGYSQKLNLQEKMGLDEKSFISEMKKIQTELDKNIDEIGKKNHAGSDVIKWKKDDINTGILSILPQYVSYKKQTSGNPSFAVSKEFKDFENSLQTNKDAMVKEHPAYRNYLLSTIGEDFQKYATAHTVQSKEVCTSQMFSNYLKEHKEFSQTTKDYLLAFVMTQSDLNPNATPETQKQVDAIINNEIKDATIKKDLKQVQYVIAGIKIGDVAPEAGLVKQDGKPFKLAELKGKPTVVMLYASWTPYIQESTIPVLKQVHDFYKEKVNFVFVNFDDTKEQFVKTSNALLKGISGTNVYAEGGLNSDFAKKYGVYGFKLRPSFMVLDKDGKVASKTFYNLGEAEFVSIMDKLSGLKAPEVKPEVTLQNDLLAPKTDEVREPEMAEPK